MTLWQRQGARIVLVCIAFLLQTALIIWLIFADRARRRAEHEAGLLLAELTHANRLATAGELTASIAHEIRQPLAAITASGNTALNWLSAQQPDLGEVQAALHRVVAQAHRADDVLTATRDIFRDQSPRREACDVRKLVSDVLRLTIHRLSGVGVIPRITFQGKSEPTVSADPVQLQQVFLNLILNSVEAMSGRPGPYLLRIATRTDDCDVIIVLDDSGPGVPSEKLEQIFQPFFTTKSEGMGMGLSICRSIIQAHGGSLKAQPNEYGATFQIVLPHMKRPGDDD
jgi:C4-dicarboxylate-specific signal transduction histidine kinase